MMPRLLRALTAVLALLVLHSGARADPWLSPGDAGIRNDIQLLADAGILRGPVTTWPLSWPDIARDALGAQVRNLDAATVDALLRVQRRARVESQRGYAGAGIRAAASSEPTELRTFGDSPRAQGEVGIRASWLSDHFALNLQGSYAADPGDGKEFRADGSYLGLNIGNFMISAGLMERWWGPGWNSSLILSTNARPIPSITLERNYTDPFKSKLLSWIGPWRASIAMGEAEEHDVAVPKVRFLAARVNFKPRPWLEFGLTRTAQWCGGARKCDWGTFTDMLLGRDNQVENGNQSAEQPGNQMAGYDFRLSSPWHALPLALYSQWIGEDEAGGLPAKFLGMFGAEVWTSSRFGLVRVRAEYADTTCEFTRQNPLFNCAYQNAIYPQGYSYRGRIIGDAMGNDSRSYSLAGLLNRPNGDVLSLLLRRLELNRDGGPHAISPVPLDLDNVELRYSRAFGFGKIGFGLGYDDRTSTADSGTNVRGFLTWQQGF
ncbi:MAG: capsule assembly Wzi family protein [Pseudomonadota bacterium]